jgi:hypothetical protein
VVITLTLLAVAIFSMYQERSAVEYRADRLARCLVSAQTVSEQTTCRATWASEW